MKRFLRALALPILVITYRRTRLYTGAWYRR